MSPLLHRFRSTLQTASLAAVLCVATLHAAGSTHVLLTQDRAPFAVTLVSLDGFALRYTDEFGMSGVVPLQSIEALLPATHGAPSLEGKSVLQLVDGQRFPGTLSGSALQQDTFQWQHDGFGTFSVSMDNVEAIIFEQSAHLPVGTPSEDTLMLTNGDKLTGFILELSTQITLETPDSGKVVLDSDKVSWLRVANEPQILDGIVVWLADGTVAHLIDIKQAGTGTVELTRNASASMVVPTQNIVAMMMSAENLTPLAAILPKHQQPIGRPRLLEPLRLASTPETMYDSSLIIPDLVFPGPMQVDWDLPHTDAIFCVAFELPESSAPWGDCQVVVSVDGIEIERLHLRNDSNTAELQIPIRGESLQIRIEPGAYGPIQDTVYMRHPVLLHN
jgi:hypothetical protein